MQVTKEEPASLRKVVSGDKDCEAASESTGWMETDTMINLASSLAVCQNIKI